MTPENTPHKTRDDNKISELFTNVMKNQFSEYRGPEILEVQNFIND